MNALKPNTIPINKATKKEGNLENWFNNVLKESTSFHTKKEIMKEKMENDARGSKKALELSPL